MTTLRHARLATLAVLATAALAGCGGGGSGDTASITPTPPVTPSAVTLTGTAATGRAWGGAAVIAKCASGNGSATTNADGSYTVSVAGGALPCIVKVTGADGKVLHSVAEGSGSSATVNISPLTELILAQAAGGSAASLFGSFDAAAQAKVSSAALAGAKTAIATALQSVINLSGIDPIKDVLVAAHGNVAGNALDQKLDVLTAALAAAKLTVAELGAAIVNNGAAAAVVVASQVQPASAHCDSLRSGDYLLLNPNETEAAYRVRKLKVDAATLTIRLADNSWAATGTPVAGRPCEFNSDDGMSTWVVSPAGAIVQRYIAQDGSNAARMAVAIPVQAHPLADLAGSWNTVEYENVGTSGAAFSFRNSFANVTVDAAGRIGAGLDCKQLLPCTAWASMPTGFLVNTVDGGFDVTESDGRVARFFAYRAPSGDMMLLGMMHNGGLIVAGKQRALAMPVVGDVGPFWDMSIGSSGVAGSLAFSIGTITTVDTVAGSYTRMFSSNGQVHTFTLNSPRDGLRHRSANGCKTGVGAAATCNGIIVMPLSGMGMGVFGSDAEDNAFFGFTVDRPAGSTGTGTSGSGASGNTAALGTLVVNGGETYPLRAHLTIDAAGQVNGGGYDFHKLDGTMTACTYSLANADTCHGTNGAFSRTSQNGAISTAGASGVSLSAGPDVFGYTFTGTLDGTTWSGSWAKVATADSSSTGSGSFSVALAISVRN